MRHIIGWFIQITLEHFLKFEKKRWTVKYLHTGKLPSNVKASTVGEGINKKRHGKGEEKENLPQFIDILYRLYSRNGHSEAREK